MSPKKIAVLVVVIGLIAMGIYIALGTVRNDQQPALYPDAITVPVLDPHADTGFDVEEPMTPHSSLPEGIKLDGMNFHAVSFNGVSIAPANIYTLSFTSTNLSAHFCNGMGGAYTFKDDVLIAPHLVGTLMYCEKPLGLMEMESTFGKILAAGATLSLKENTLTIRDAQNTFVYTVTAHQ